MKQVIKSILFTILMSMVGTKMNAYDFEVDGIYYNVISFEKMTAGVTHGEKYIPPTSHYSGSISIPSFVTYNGKNFSVISICEYAFRESTVTSVYLPNSIVEICERAFEDCQNLVNVNISNRVRTIGSSAFRGCNKLKEIYIPESVTTIGSYAFSGCTNLSSVTISNGITKIPEYLFAYCRNISTLAIPNSVKTMDNNAFCHCKIDTFIISPDVESFSYNPGIEVNNFYIKDSDKEFKLSSYDDVIYLDSMYLGRNTSGSTCFCPTKLEIGENVTLVNNALPNHIVAIRTRLFDPPIWSGRCQNFSNNQFMNVPVLVPSGSIPAYESANIWKKFWNIREYLDDGTEPETKKCEMPSISYCNGKLIFATKTEGATCYYSITDSDIKAGSGSELQLAVTYNISVYASKTGCENSETATATLCWIDATPQTEGITDGVAQISSKAVLIQSEGGILKVEGVDDGTPISVYTLDGKQAGSAVSRNGAALIGTNIQPGNATIVKIGNKSVKVIMK